MSDVESLLTTQEKEARAKYFREWRAKNRDRVKAYNQRYWQKKAREQQEAERGVANVEKGI